MCLYLKKLYSPHEIEQILNWLKTHDCEGIERIEEHSELLFAQNLSKSEVYHNFKALYEFSLIIDIANDRYTQLDNKEYKTNRDYVELCICKAMKAVDKYVKECLQNNQAATEVLDHTLFYWRQYFVKVQLHGFDMMSLVLFLQELKPWTEQISRLSEVGVTN